MQSELKVREKLLGKEEVFGHRVACDFCCVANLMDFLVGYDTEMPSFLQTFQCPFE